MTEGACAPMRLHYPYLEAKMLVVKYTVQSPQKFTNPIVLVCIQILPSVALIFQSIHYVKIKKYTLKHHSVPVLMADYLTIYYYILLYKTEV